MWKTITRGIKKDGIFPEFSLAAETVGEKH